MQVGSIAASGPRNQSALKLITDIVETSKVGQSDGSDVRKPWSSTTAANSISSRAASAIQDIVSGRATGTTTFKILGGGDRTVPTDEYDFATRTTFQTPEDLAAEYRTTQVAIFDDLIKQATSSGQTEQAEFLTAQNESLKRALANGTFKVELLDDRVSGNDYNYTGVRDSNGNVGGLYGVNVKPLDWDAFNKVYGDGKGGYDRNYWVGGNYFMRGYAISWPK